MDSFDTKPSLQIRLSFDPDATGWAYLMLGDGRTEHQFKCSWLCDTLGDLIRGLAKSTQVGKHEIHATDENHQDILITVRRVDESIELVVKKRLVGAKRENWKSLFRFRAEITDVCAAFARAFSRAIEPLGPDGYRKLWGHPFPMNEFKALVSFAAARGEGRAT